MFIKFPNSYFIVKHILSTSKSPQIKTDQSLFCKVNLVMFGARNLDCDVENK